MARLLSVALCALLIVPIHMMPRQRGGPLGGPTEGMMQWEPVIPSRLPSPTDQWLARLTEVLAIEEQSQAQYESDAVKYHTTIPYQVVLAQERDHIRWIRELYRAYGISPVVRPLPLRASTTLDGALEIGRSIETDLLLRYEDLVAGSNDPTTREVLAGIRFQTRHHLMMFEHALGGMGRGPMSRY